MTNEGEERTLPLDDAGQIYALREEFERGWKSDVTSRIEDYLIRVLEGLRLAAFQELLSAEIKLRRARQEPVVAEDYLARFPKYESVVRSACGNAGEDQATIAFAPSGPRSGLHVRCPHCHNPIELVPDANLDSIKCDSCNSHFSLTSEPVQATHDSRGCVQIGHFQLVERLGMGAFGTVWKAQDTELDRTVAIKIPRAGQLDKQQQEFFLREARAAAQLRHPNIVPVHEVGRDGDTIYIVSEFVRGVTLGDWVSGKQPTVRESAELCARIADALHHAHEQGVIHRDLKPANVIIDDAGQPHIMDFGLARRETREITMTVEGKILGTPAYMSPEQARGDAHTADRRSDVYSVGVMLFELLTGELPFRGNVRMLIQQVLHDEPPSPRKLNASVPKDLETISLKCLEKEPSRRFTSAYELAIECRRFLAGEPILARPISRVERGWRWCRRKPMAATAAALVVFVAIASPVAAVREASLRQRAEENESIATEAKALESSLRQKAEQNELIARQATSAAEASASAAQKSQKESETAYLKLRDETSKVFFVHGAAEYAAGRVDTGCDEIFRAWAISPETSPIRAGYQRVLADRLTRGERSYISMRHSGAIIALAVSTDGKKILTGSEDNTARVWSAVTGRPLGKVMQHTEPVTCVAFSQDGRLALTGSGDDTAQVWNATTGEPLGERLRHQSEVLSVAFSPDGKRVLTGSQDETAQLWDAATGQPLGDPIQHESHVSYVAFSPDGKRLLTGGSWNNKSALLWDAETSRPLGEPMRHEETLTAVLLSPDGKRVLTGSQDRTTRLWDATTGRPLGEPLRHDESVSMMAFSPDGSIILTVTSQLVQLWEAATGAPRGEPMRHQAACVAFSPDGKLILTGSEDHAARLWDARTGRPRGEPMQHEASVACVAFMPDGKSFLTGSGTTARVWSLSTGWHGRRMLHVEGNDVDPFEAGQSIRLVAFSPDGNRILTASEGRAARLWDAATDQPVGKPMLHGGSIESIAFSPDGTFVLTGSNDESAQLWDATTGQPLGKPQHFENRCWSIVTQVRAGYAESALAESAVEVPHGEINGGIIAPFVPYDIRPVEFGTDGRSIMTRCRPSAPQWNPLSCQPLNDAYPGQWVTAAARSPDGQRVFTATSDGKVSVWNAENGQPIDSHLSALSGYAVAFNADGRRALTILEEGVAQHWDVATGQPLGEPMRHTGRIVSFAFSPDGTCILTGTEDLTARLWDATTGQPLGEPVHHQGWIDSGISAIQRGFTTARRQNGNRIGLAAFNSDGTRAVTGATNGITLLWDSSRVPVPSNQLAWFELLLGKRLDDSDQLVPLTAVEIKNRWELLGHDREWVKVMRATLEKATMSSADPVISESANRKAG